MAINRQEAFNIAYRGLRSQGFEQSLLPGTKATCAYRGAEGRRCAIGWLVGDDVYDPKMEGGGVHRLVSYLQTKYSSDDQEFLGELQACHDRYSAGDPAVMQSYLAEFARRYDLQVPQE